MWGCVLGVGFWPRPATYGWGVRCGCVCLGSGVGCAPPLLARVLACACLCARSACTPLLLAEVWGLGVCAWARVSAAPRHSWLRSGVWVCVLGLGFRLGLATPGWGVGVCVRLCARSACTPPLLRGCAVWACVLGLGFWLRPATPGWGSGMCVYVCALRL